MFIYDTAINFIRYHAETAELIITHYEHSQINYLCTGKVPVLN
jgi:hypothetical protein